MSQWVAATKVTGRELLVFLKHARPGVVKTRLVPALGAAHAAELYRALAEAVLEATVPRPGEYERQVFYDPPEAAEAMRSWLPGMRLIPQGGGDLGARMEAAFSRSFRRGARRVALIGTDTPGAPRGARRRDPGPRARQPKPPIAAGGADRTWRSARGAGRRAARPGGRPRAA